MADIRQFFDTLNHDWMLKFLSHRIQDKCILRLISKWLKIGVLEVGEHTTPTVGLHREQLSPHSSQHLLARDSAMAWLISASVMTGILSSPAMSFHVLEFFGIGLESQQECLGFSHAAEVLGLGFVQ